MSKYEGVVIRLDPNNAQASYMAGCAGAYRKAYNFAVEKLKAHSDDFSYLRGMGVPRDALPTAPSARDLQDRWHGEKDSHAPWHSQYPSKTYLFALQAAHRAWRRWLTHKGGFPRFQTCYGPKKFKVCESIRLEARHLALPKMGLVKIYRPDAAQARVRRLLRRGKARVVSASVRRSPSGVWTAALTLEVERARAPREVAPDRADGALWPAVVGADLGVKTRVVAANPNGVLVAEARGVNALRNAAVKLRRDQRKLSRQDRVYGESIGAVSARRSPSRRREKSRLRIARVHARVANSRRTVTHQLTAQLARLDAYVVVEDLAVKGMARKGGARKKGLNRAIHDAALAEIRRQLTYKLPAGRLLTADRWFPSSKTCSKCEGKNQTLTLADRFWTCTRCNTFHDRDVNAATNLAVWGKRQLDAAGIQTGDRDWPGPSEGESPHARGAAHKPGATASGACNETGTQHPHAGLAAVGSVWDGPGHGLGAAGDATSIEMSSQAPPGKAPQDKCSCRS